MANNWWDTITYTAHARTRMAQRRVSVRQIESILRSPDHVSLSTDSRGVEHYCAERRTTSGNMVFVYYDPVIAATGTITVEIISVKRTTS